MNIKKIQNYSLGTELGISPLLQMLWKKGPRQMISAKVK
jgi:hypothetical protein